MKITISIESEYDKEVLKDLKKFWSTEGAGNEAIIKMSLRFLRNKLKKEDLI